MLMIARQFGLESKMICTMVAKLWELTRNNKTVSVFPDDGRDRCATFEVYQRCNRIRLRKEASHIEKLSAIHIDLRARSRAL